MRGAAAPGGEAYERLGPLYDRWCAGVDHDIAFYREGAFVGFVTNLTIKPNDQSFTEDILGQADTALKDAIA